MHFTPNGLMRSFIGIKWMRDKDFSVEARLIGCTGLGAAGTAVHAEAQLVPSDHDREPDLFV